jgi:probable addiction module antidote protein
LSRRHHNPQRVSPTGFPPHLAACLKGGRSIRHISLQHSARWRARGMMKLAKKTGLTREGLYKALSKNGNPNLGTILKVLQALGLKLTVSPV